MKDALEQTRNAYTDGGEWAQTITEQFCKDIDEQPTIDVLTAQEESQEVSNNSPELDKENGELISRHDAIDLIERYCDNGCEIAEDKWCPDCQQSKFAEMIKALPPSSSRPQWIPVSERLPDEEVLCCDTRGEMIIGYPYQDEESNTGYSAVLDDIVMIDCTAWMPLPKPYQGK